jgi:hypothetical protein
MKIRPVEDELFHAEGEKDRRKDGQTDMTSSLCSEIFRGRIKMQPAKIAETLKARLPVLLMGQCSSLGKS